MEVTTWQRWSLRLYADDIICGSLSLVRAMHGGRKYRLDATTGAKNQMTQWTVDVKALARYGQGNRIEKRCNGQRRVDVGYILAAKSLWHHWSYLHRLGICFQAAQCFHRLGQKFVSKLHIDYRFDLCGWWGRITWEIVGQKFDPKFYTILL